MIGLGVMGANLARNIERNGFPCLVYNRTTSVTEEFLAQFGAGSKFTAAKTLPELVQGLAKPRQIFVMVQAGAAVDAVMQSLLPLLEPGDIIIDGGNSYFTDTNRREKECAAKQILFVGAGVSGGETGALNGPSIMPGGPKACWSALRPMLEAMSAKVGGDPCTAYIGPEGAGHFVKMVHNGIEYADMQLIAEAYNLLRDLAGQSNGELAGVFEKWNSGALSSYLIEITGKILRKKDDQSSKLLVDMILDRAGQKGTGKWTVQVALDLGIAIPTIAAAVDARVLSAKREERIVLSKTFATANTKSTSDAAVVDLVRDALYASKLLAYAQGIELMSAASRQWQWGLRISEIASIWRGGCIIRAALLEKIRSAYASVEPGKEPHLALASGIKEDLLRTVPALREVVSRAARAGIPLLGFSSALSYFESYRREFLPQNLIQAQRDFFGAHTYERIDKPGSFHTQWE